MVAACSGGWLLAARPPAVAARRSTRPASVTDRAGASGSTASLLSITESVGVQPMAKSQPKKSRADRARDIALYRYSLIRPLADPGLSPTERGRLVRELAAQVHIGPDRGAGDGVAGQPGPLDPGVAGRRVRRADPGRTPGCPAHRRRGAGAGRAAQTGTPGAHRRAYRPDHRRRAGLGALAAHPAAPLRPPGAEHPPGRHARRRRSAGSRPASPTSCGSATGCTARSSRASARCCSRCSTTTPATWSGTAGGTARTPWACRRCCTTRSRPTAARESCTATTAARTPPTSWPGRRRCWTSGWCTASPENRRARARSNGGTAPCATSSWSRSTRPARRGIASLAELNRLFTAWCHQQYHRGVHSETGATPAQRYHAEDRARRRGRTRRCCAARSCGASSAGSPRSRPCPCTATATRSTPRWSAASSTCCSPRST